MIKTICRDYRISSNHTTSHLRIYYITDNLLSCSSFESADDIAHEILYGTDPFYFRLYNYERDVIDNTAVSLCDYLLAQFEEIMDHDGVIRELSDEESDELLPFYIDEKYLASHMKIKRANKTNENQEVTL